ncbi:outer membrane protein assembly factor BamE [Citreimonas salinaria]|uniref:Beta-barrel assembly machine subunit BamE n=1 Tax=Citreimonas salinaria TaxID=321339 RepID=A0A1H3KPE2_9RHOB|nr:outer membrane protein assembly factor BamE [Citreimonas salinaria]SDY54037.1 Beta-barrel assembly machine subunit BamE [Citreimonas salinaria]
MERTHGWTPPDELLQQIVPGIDSRATVEDVVGPPTASGVLNDGGFYYIETDMRRIGWRAPEITDRRVVAITFDETGVVSNIAEYGLEDGRIVPISRRVTQSTDSNIGFIRRLFGNIGGLSLPDIGQ